MEIRLAIIDEDEGWCAKLERYLSIWENLYVVGTATNIKDIIQIIDVKKPEILLLDMNLTVNYLEGVPFVSQILKLHQCQIIMLTSFMETNLVREAIMMGAIYCMRKSDYQALPVIIRSASLIEVIATDYRRLLNRVKLQEFLKDLTPAEIELVKHLKSDKPLAEIAVELFKSEKTLRNQLTYILRKLNLKNRMEIIEKIDKEFQC